MKDAITASTKAVWNGVGTVARGVRRGVVGICAAVAMVVIYSAATIGSYGLSVAGISTAALVTSATKADAYRRRRGWRRRRRRGVWLSVGPRRRRRRRWRRRRRSNFGIYFGW